MHLVPCGVFNDCLNIIGNGVVIEPEQLFREMDDLTARGVDLSRLHISDRAHIVCPTTLIIDRADELASGEAAIGTTGKGIGPAYADKVSRKGIRVSDLLDEEALAIRLRAFVTEKNTVLQHLYGLEPLTFEELYLDCVQTGATVPIRRDAATGAGGDRRRRDGAGRGRRGAARPGVRHLPLRHFVVAVVGRDVRRGRHRPDNQVTRVIGVYKAYTSRVGNGPSLPRCSTRRPS